ncbi:MAG TPA: alkaline phosphatase D family protein [Gaiellales bacterium]|jgi:hypothetical protein|nr:alkaline phosphatase D family protein [Gaiellales bacterium]
MPSLLLGPMLRYVGRTEATIWVETDAPCIVTIGNTSAPTFEVEGHHYALVELHGLDEGSVLDYEVALDGDRVWPSPSLGGRPPSQIRTRMGERQARLAFGSCRVGAPQRKPYTLSPTEDSEGLGVDALWAYSRRLQAGIEPWPDCLLLIGDQVYADEVSPQTLEYMRGRRDMSQPPGEEVADFEEYTHLYREAWSDPDIRWLFSTVPSVMVFDDHDVIDDWNISWKWIEDARAEGWWDARITGAFMSYWIYQHLGNLAPPELPGEPLYGRAAAGEDIGAALRASARKADRDSAASRWACYRDFGRSRVVVVDSRAARVLSDGRRDMVDDDEWAWIRELSGGEFDHLVIVSSMPVFLSHGVHYLEAWNEAVCAGAWGGAAVGAGERLRRALDLEHWPAFQRSFERMMQLLRDVASGAGGHPPPASVTLLGGDVHHSSIAEVSLGRFLPEHSRVHQLVCSPFRNPLGRAERRVVALTGTRALAALLRTVARLAGVQAPSVRWRYRAGPTFDNTIGILELDGRRAEAALYRAEPGLPERSLQPLHRRVLAGGAPAAAPDRPEPTPS